jgi:hypothetical protein
MVVSEDFCYIGAEGEETKILCFKERRELHKVLWQEYLVVLVKPEDQCSWNTRK